MPQQSIGVRPLAKALQATIAFIALGASTWCGWVTVALYSRPTVASVRTMVEREPQYMKERAMILGAIAKMEQSNERLRVAIENNTRVIVRLETVLAK